MAGRIRELGPNHFVLIVELGKGPDGKRRQKSKVFHGGKRAAEKEFARLQVLWGDRASGDPEKMTLRQLLDLWIKNHAEMNVSAKTLQTYKGFIDSHLGPKLGSVQLAKLTPFHIEDYQNHALKNGRADGKGGLDPQSVVHHRRLLHVVLQYALKKRLITFNPVDLTDAPTLKKKKKSKRVADDDARRLLAEIRGTAMYIPSLLSVGTALRRGEVLALLWKDVDLNTGLIQVYRSLSQTRAGLVFKGTKRPENVRELHLPPDLIVELRRHRAEQALRKLALGDQYQEHGLICCWEDGRPIQPDYLSKAFTKRARRLGIGSTFHGLRHTHLSHLAEDGENPRAVSNRAGHSDVKITLDLYTDLSPKVDQSMAQRYNTRLRGLLGRDEESAGGAAESA